jgi:hypothetical protein
MPKNGSLLATTQAIEVGRIDVPSTKNSKDEDKDQEVNISALFCPAPDWCVLVSDELRGFHRLKVSRDQNNMPNVSHEVALEFDLPDKEFLKSHGINGGIQELDLEAIAATPERAYFFGSHANKRKRGTVNPASHLVAIAKIEDLETKAKVPAQWTSLDKLFDDEKGVLPRVLNKQLQCGGLNIEGATILGENLLIGIRTPSRGTDGSNPAAYIISTPLNGLLKQNFLGARLHALPTDQPFIGIRALETVGDSVVVITGDAGTSDLEDKKGKEIKPECGKNRYKEDPDRPFQMRVWKPGRGADAFEPCPVITFRKLKVKEGPDGKVALAKLEAIAADPARAGAFFVLYDGSPTVYYLTGINVE